MMTPRSFKLGAVVRADVGSGLQTQTLNLTKMLKPDRLMVIDSTAFNKRRQDFTLYDNFEGFRTRGFPTNHECLQFVRGLTHAITAETAYNPALYGFAKANNVKIFTQLNWEFLDHLKNPHMAQPYKWLMPSYWFLGEMKAKFPNTEYLPPPLFSSEFSRQRTINFKRTGRRKFIHIVGTLATSDRNGTLDVLNAVKHCKEDFLLKIYSQSPIEEYLGMTNDHRVRFQIGNLPNHADLYEDADALIMPRRYGGLCLPMNEALMSGLPVIMTNIDPNNRILPLKWLVSASTQGTIMTRMQLNLYSADHRELAKKIDEMATMDNSELFKWKSEAFQLGFENFDSSILKSKYEKVMEIDGS